MLSGIFVNDSEIAEYSWKLLVMMSVLFLATFANWFLIIKMKMSKYKAVAIAMSIWLVLVPYITLFQQLKVNILFLMIILK